MVSIPLPAFEPSVIKATLPQERYDALLANIAGHLRPLQAADAWRFVQTYVTDQASTLSSASTPGERKLRRAVLELAERITGGQ